MDRLDLERVAGWSSRAAGATLALAFAASCGGAPGGPPTIALDRSVCDGCGMLISEPGYAAAYRAGRRTAVFDDIGCLLADLETSGAETTEQVWFLDGDQRWIAAGDATFVRSPRLETPMGGHIVAFSDLGDAERTAARVGGVVVASFAELTAGARAEALEGELDAPSN